MATNTGSPLPATRIYSGRGLDPDALARGVEAWLKGIGFEVRSAGTAGSRLVQGRIADTGWKSWFAKTPSLDVRVEGTRERLTVGFGDGTWGLDSAESVGRKVGGFLTAVWSGSAEERRKDIEKKFWRAVETACRACGALGSNRTGKTVLSVVRDGEGVTDRGLLHGIETYTDDYCCSACGGKWSSEPQQIGSPLCPGCKQPCDPEAAGETVVHSSLIGEESPGVYKGAVLFCKRYSCPECRHAWNGKQEQRKATVCPSCVKPVSGTEVRREVLRTTQRTIMVTTKDTHYANDGGIFRPATAVGHSERQQPVLVEYEVSVGVHSCEHCSHEWKGAVWERPIE
ncbi:hypothetical protein R5W24_003355 [Gemmata sp. JC717]|uniref:hypothetical protein n=1 Tax=Gemmata algarum TaxID=2975278 RepID=UPI0021BB9032|nr:hypothetical protein [Gemmata algarum]MDY3554236.1 hypothetical protein [Gemmata algarum]